MLELRCSKHPTYGAVHKPRVDCRDCWELYGRKNRGKLINISDNIQKPPTIKN